MRSRRPTGNPYRRFRVLRPHRGVPGRPPAFSLAEAIIGAALASSLLALCVLVLVPLSRSTVRATDQAELRQLALVTLERLSADLATSAAPGLEVHTDPLVLSIHPIVGLTEDGAQVWAQHLVIWGHDAASHRLLRRQTGPTDWPPSPSRGSRPPANLLPTLAAGGQVAAHSVKALTLEGLAPGRVSPPIRLTLELERESTRGPERFSLATSVMLRQRAGRSVPFTP